MSQQRPSTLKLWRFLLDLCEVLDQRAGGMSSYDAATVLRAKYNEISSDALLQRFGLTDDASEIKKGFPSQATVIRYLDLIEDDLRAFFPNRRQLIPRSGKGDRVSFQKPDSKDVQLVRAIGNGLFTQLERLAAERQPIALAASDSVTYFLLSRLDVLQVLGEKYFLNTQKFVPSEVTRALRAGEWDAAIGWENGYGQETELNHSIGSRILHGSECDVRLLIHPSWRPSGSTATTRNPFAARKREYIESHPDDPEGYGYSVTPEYLQKARLVYPDLPQVARIGEAFKNRKIAEGYQIDHFSSVVNAVRMNNGIGLIFGLPWLMREFEQEYHLITAGLQLPAEWNLSTRMALRAFVRADDSEATKGATTAASNLVAALEGVLTNYGSTNGTTKPSWKLAGTANATEKMFAGQTWNVWFVTSGKFASAPLPHWRQGTVEFEAKKNKDKLLPGKLYLPNEPDKPFMDVWLNPGALLDNFLMLRFRRLTEGKTLGTQTSAYFPARITRNGYDGACFLGSLSFAVEDRPFVSPILFSDKPLELSDCRNVASSHLLDLLHGNEPGT